MMQFLCHFIFVKSKQIDSFPGFRESRRNVKNLDTDSVKSAGAEVRNVGQRACRPSTSSVTDIR